MKSVVVDTHAAVWYVTQPGKLSKVAEAALDAVLAAGEPIFLASISLVEIRYLVEKSKLVEAVFDQILLATEGDAPA